MSGPPSPEPVVSKRAKTSLRRSLRQPEPDAPILPQENTSSVLPPPIQVPQYVHVSTTDVAAGISSCSTTCNFPAVRNENVQSSHSSGVAHFGDVRVTEERTGMSQVEGLPPSLPQPEIPEFTLHIPKTATTFADKCPAVFSELLIPQICPLRQGAGSTVDISSFLNFQPHDGDDDDGNMTIPVPSPPSEPQQPSSPPHPTSPSHSSSAPTAGSEDASANLSIPLFEGSTITANDCLISILTYAHANHLSGTSTCELIRLLEILLPQPNNLPKSTTLFKKYFQDNVNELRVYFFCSNCWSSRNSISDICTVCSAPNRKVSYYITCSLEQQLQRLYARPGFCDLLQYKNTRVKENEANIEDILDSKIYKEAEKDILNNTNNISFTWYSDGVQVYEVSTFGLWMSMLTINELPPEERKKPENVLVSGIWGGDSKPHPNIFLLPAYHDMVKINKGVQVKPYNSQHDITVCGFLLFGTCDMPAKSNFMNMKSHTGYYSCTKCHIKGEKSDRTGKVMVFPHEEHLELRNDQNYEVCFTEGVKSKDGCKGVYGPSILYFMFSGSFISGMTIDSMHSQFMGNMKLFLKLWFDEKYSSELFSLREKIPIVNERLRALSLPHFVQRLPIDVDKNLCYLKASLCRNYFFYILPIVLNGVLKPTLFENFMKLVSGVALLNKSSISEEDLIQADLLLNEFSEEFQNLYGLRHMSSNIHSTRHLVQCVRETGNLYHMSCFEYEDLNGKLVSLVHGTRHAVIQISNHLKLFTELPLLIDTVKSESVKMFCLQAVRRSKNFTVTEKICNQVHVVGKIMDISSHATVIIDLLNHFAGIQGVRYFNRLHKHGQLYVSESYRKGSRVSSYCKYRCQNELFHGNILTFVKAATANTVKYLAFIRRTHDVPINNVPRFFEFTCSDDVDLIPVSELLSVSFYLSVSGKCYLVDSLNTSEME